MAAIAELGGAQAHPRQRPRLDLGSVTRWRCRRLALEQNAHQRRQGGLVSAHELAPAPLGRELAVLAGDGEHLSEQRQSEPLGHRRPDDSTPTVAGQDRRRCRRRIADGANRRGQRVRDAEVVGRLEPGIPQPHQPRRARRPRRRQHRQRIGIGTDGDGDDLAERFGCAHQRHVDGALDQHDRAGHFFPSRLLALLLRLPSGLASAATARANASASAAGSPLTT